MWVEPASMMTSLYKSTLVMKNAKHMKSENIKFCYLVLCRWQCIERNSRMVHFVFAIKQQILSPRNKLHVR